MARRVIYSLAKFWFVNYTVFDQRFLVTCCSSSICLVTARGMGQLPHGRTKLRTPQDQPKGPEVTSKRHGPQAAPRRSRLRSSRRSTASRRPSPPWMPPPAPRCSSADPGASAGRACSRPRSEWAETREAALRSRRLENVSQGRSRLEIWMGLNMDNGGSPL